MATAIIGGTKDTWGFDPRILPGIYAWFDATDASSVILDGFGNVSAWLDKSGNNRHLFQNTASNRPSYASNYIQCISGNQGLDTSGFPATNTEYMIACLSKCLTQADASDGRVPTTNNPVRALYTVSASNNLIMNPVGNNTLGSRVGGANFFPTFTELTTFGGGGNTVVTMGVNTARQVSLLTYNGCQISGIGGTTIGNSAITKVGNDVSNAWGEIQEILVFQPILTQDYRKQVESYLAWKGGLGYMSDMTPAATPLNVTSATCFQWFDASDSTTVDLSGATRWVTRWRDKSGLSLDASQTVPTSRMFYSSNGYMDISGTAFLNQRTDASSYVVNRSFSFFVVENRKYGGTGYMLGHTGGGAGSNLFFGYSNVNTFIVSFSGDNQGISIPYTYPSYNQNPEGPIIWYCSYDASTSYRRISSNGINRTTIKTSTRLGAYLGPAIGKAGSTGNYNGYLYEVIMYNNVLSDTDESNVGSYLARKWGINTNVLTFTSANREYPALNRNFIPTDISALALWYDAASPATVSLSGDLVVNWADKSGNARDASTNSNCPTYTVGSNYIQFSGSNWLSYPATFLSNTQYTLFFTVARDVSKAEHIITSSGTGGTNANLITGYSPNMYVFKYGYFANDTSFTAPAFTTLPEPANLITLQQTATQRLAWYNGTQTLTNTNATLLASQNDGLLGVYLRTASTAWNGKMYEINMFTRALSTTERQQMEGYLAWKWGTRSNLPSTHPYFSLPPAMTRFHPLMPATPILWLDAQDRSTYDLSGTSYISSLVDKSGYKGTLTTSLGAGYRPGYISNGLNGYPCFTTDVSNPGRRLYGTYGTAARVSAQQYAVCCILTPESIVQNSSRIFSTQATTGDDFGSGGGFSTFSATTPSSVAPYTLSANRVPTRIRLYPATFSNVPTIFTISGTTSAAGILSNWGLGLGVMFPDTGGGAMWQMRVGEVLVYRQSLDFQTLLRIEGYLAWKWDAQSALSNNHPYKNVRP